MQYQQSRDQSAELLRLAVGYMGRQQAAFDPASYTLWYEHAAGLNPALSRVLDDRLAGTKPLTDVDVSRLYAQHIASRETEAIGRIQQRLLSLVQEISQAVSQTGTHSAKFGQALESQAERLQQPDSVESIQAIVSDLLAETQQMSAINLTLGRQLDARAQEVQHLTQRLEQAQVDALNDPLTGLLNRRGFEQPFADLSAQSTPLQGIALLLADVDQFKTINDTYGHSVGDQVLRGVAQVLRARIKGSDLAARLGGDEFAILLPDTTLAGAMVLAEQIRTAFLRARLRTVEGDKHLGNVSVSIGVSHSSTGASLSTLMKSADAALYLAKREGRNQVRSADAGTSAG